MFSIFYTPAHVTPCLGTRCAGFSEIVERRCPARSKSASGDTSRRTPELSTLPRPSHLNTKFYSSSFFQPTMAIASTRLIAYDARAELRALSSRRRRCDVRSHEVLLRAGYTHTFTSGVRTRGWTAGGGGARNSVGHSQADAGVMFALLLTAGARVWQDLSFLDIDTFMST